MLEEMRMSGLGVIQDAVLPLAPGLTVITGETGAGKTMVVTGLGLLFGGRADSALVRGAGPALVEGHVRIDLGGPVAARAAEIGAQLDDDVLLIARSVSIEGRSRAHVGGRAVPAGVLAELGEHCLAVHGQADQYRLLSASRQRDAVDRFAGDEVARLKETFSGLYTELRGVERDVEELRVRAREREQEADLLRFGLDEIERLAPQHDEDVSLAAEEQRLGHADALRGAAATAHALLAGDADAAADGVADAHALLAAARAAVEQPSEHDPELAAMAARLRDAGYLIDDVAADLASYVAAVETDPVRLAAVQDRRAAITRLARKYGGQQATLREVLAWAEGAARRLHELDGDDSRIANLERRRVDLRASLAEVGAALSAARAAAARVLADAVTTELGALAMPQARLEVAVGQKEDPNGLEVDDDGGARTLAYGPHGLDDVDILLCPHAGAGARPLHKGASGGELSRVMLAVEVVFAGADPIPTMVFDEVDAGVGGKAAVEVGRRLARLARTTQVIVVTHLPQVAAFADRHLVVRKSDQGAVTTSDVSVLDDDGRVRELSRMFAGLEDSDAARRHAIELLAASGRAGAEAVVTAR